MSAIELEIKRSAGTYSFRTRGGCHFVVYRQRHATVSCSCIGGGGEIGIEGDGGVLAALRRPGPSWPRFGMNATDTR